MNRVESQSIEGVSHIELQPFEDGRGFFMETFRRSWLPDSDFVQGNLSSSTAGVLRGLHYHLRQEDLWLIPSGLAHVTLVDLRASSTTFRAIEQFELHGPRAVHIPIGVAHGFYVGEPTLMSYMVTGYYDGTDEHGVLWNDPDLGVTWPTDTPILSERDLGNPKWSDVPVAERPR